MAKIYRAIEKATGRIVAIKLLRPDNKDSHRNQRRFRSEIQAIKAIRSPYVVSAFDFAWDDKVQYIAMEYIDGSILKEYIGRRGNLTVDEAVEFAKQIALGLHEMHQAGIIHRDIKASNIMITDHGQVKIIDLGIALHDETDRVTQTDNIIGSVQYLAPELLEKEEANAQTDIYALGILLYEMLIGDVPFKEKTGLDTARKHQTSTVPHVNKIFKNIPQAVANVVIRSTAKKPQQRYSSAYKLYEDLDTCLSDKRLYEPVYQLSDRLRKTWVEKINSSAFWLVVGLVTIVILIAIVITLIVVK
ncbi:uncharacterized protein LOC111627202 [Centruroides sculpturatus]|uniref:uncharacterized protein LOC111627202 n=1 Tax=Centruroides sculpturatus TaxID=218467 RepID=UPI000C6D5299|nr:uncharacterized protein LOC111627202 [Centruroides sculpturatus]